MKSEKATFPLRIPAKLILFGEWAVLNGYPAIGCSVGKYFEASLETHNKADSLFIESHEIHFEWQTLEQKSPAFLEKSCAILKSLYPNPIEALRGKKLRLERQWELSEGLGSSSALFLALSLLSHLDPKSGLSAPSASDLRKDLVDFQGSGSGFDILIQALGGFLTAKIQGNSVEAKKLELDIPEEILFVHTAKKMKTDLALQDFKTKDDSLKDFSKIIGKSSEDFLITRDWFKSIKEHNACLEKMGVVPNFVRDLKDHWIEKKWINALKTTGAGGGDTLMLHINTCKRPELEADLSERGFWLEEAPLGVPGALEAH